MLNSDIYFNMSLSCEDSNFLLVILWLLVAHYPSWLRWTAIIPPSNWALDSNPGWTMDICDCHVFHDWPKCCCGGVGGEYVRAHSLLKNAQDRIPSYVLAIDPKANLIARRHIYSITLNILLNWDAKYKMHQNSWWYKLSLQLSFYKKLTKSIAYSRRNQIYCILWLSFSNYN